MTAAPFTLPDPEVPPNDADALAQPQESTATLLRRVREGEPDARERLCARYLPMLRRWASGRLPPQARDLADTDDMVQITLLRALKRIDEFQPRHEGAFLAYLRRIMINNIRAEIRRVTGLPQRAELSPERRDDGPEVVEQVAELQLMEHYEAAMEKLGETKREAVMLRVEFGFSYAEIAQALDLPTANAARMCVCRALAQLAELM